MKLFRVLRGTFFSSLPLAAITIVVCCFIAPMENLFDYVKLVIGYAGVVIGQSIFIVGLDVSILPIGKTVGESLIKLKKVAFIVFFGFLFGLIAEIAEPDLTVFTRQVHLASSQLDERVLLVIMSAGIGVFVGLGLYRILKDISIKVLFGVCYIVIFLIAIFTPQEFIGLAFDGSGATTGDIAVPFMLALGIGVSATMSKRKTDDDSFGIIGIASMGPILAVFVYGILYKYTHNGTVPIPNVDYDPGAVDNFIQIAGFNFREALLTLVPIVVVFVPFQYFIIKLNKRDFRRIIFGVVPVFIGHLIFLTCVDFGFAYAGQHIGSSFFAAYRAEWFKWLLLPVGFVLGGSITLSEPNVTVLGLQLEEITNGHIKQMTIRLTLALALGVASVLSIVKIITQISILWFLIPLYAAALILMKFSTKMFVGLAFDSGGVGAGGLSSAFLTPFMLGIAQAVAVTVNKSGGVSSSILTNGFGIIAFMSVMPIIAVQTLGLVYKWRFKIIQEQFNDQEQFDLDALTSHNKEEN